MTFSKLCLWNPLPRSDTPLGTPTGGANLVLWGVPQGGGVLPGIQTPCKLIRSKRFSSSNVPALFASCSVSLLVSSEFSAPHLANMAHVMAAPSCCVCCRRHAPPPATSPGVPLASQGQGGKHGRPTTRPCQPETEYLLQTNGISPHWPDRPRAPIDSANIGLVTWKRRRREGLTMD